MITDINIIVLLIIFLFFLSNTYETFYIPWNLATRSPRYYWDIRGNPLYGYYGSREMIYPLDLFPWRPWPWWYRYSYNADGTLSI